MTNFIVLLYLQPDRFPKPVGFIFSFLYIRVIFVQLIENITKSSFVWLSEVEAFKFGIWNLEFEVFRSHLPLCVTIFCFLKEKAKGFPLLSGLGRRFSKENNPKNKTQHPFKPDRF
ncbi:hypothetical protein, partial [Flavobacterium sp. T12S277]|uniref:hypothetical protein n=1 Tax=Flavobacterium sp. T12S277 TaxID=3402752 RepID=UPI003AEC09AE